MKKILTLSFICLIVFGFLLLAGFKIFKTSWFCLQCHEKSNIAENWKKSKHGPSNPEMNNCIHCHSRPGFIGLLQSQVGKFFSHLTVFDFLDSFLSTENQKLRPSKSVTCVQEGCHQMDLLDRSLRRQISLSHSVHVKIMEEIGTRSKCMPCHIDIAHGEFKFLPDMKSTCFLCHSEQDTQSSNCDLCHKTHPGVQLKGRDTSLFELHNTTNKKTKISCLECHLDHCKASKANCEKCHAGKNYGDLIEYQGLMSLRNENEEK